MILISILCCISITNYLQVQGNISNIRKPLAILGQFIVSQHLAVIFAHNLFLLVYSINVQEIELKREKLKTDQASCVLQINTGDKYKELISAPPFFR